jgi:hypothetical protein
MVIIRKEQGMALIVVLGIMALAGFLGLSAFRWSIDELKMAAHEIPIAQSHYVAEAGIARILQAFHDPADFPDDGSLLVGFPEENRAVFLLKRMEGPNGGSGYLDQEGRSQFSGTEAVPDYFFEDTTGSGAVLGTAFDHMGVLESLKLYGPESPGAVCTVAAMGRSRGGGRRSVRVQFTPGALPAVTAAVQTEMGGRHPVPVLVHWGDLRAAEDMDLGGELERIPKKDTLAEEDGSPYGVGERVDGWVDYLAGGRLVRPDPSGCPACAEPFGFEGHGNIHQYQELTPDGLSLDAWNYGRLKALAKDYGVYYGTDPDGNLYLDGIEDLLHRMDPVEALSSAGGRLVYIDTTDGNPPGGANLASLVLPVDFSEGYFFIHANVTIRNEGAGRILEAKTPPREGTADESTRQAVVLSNINVKGILAVAGRRSVEGHPSVYGAVMAHGGFGGTGELEVWYDADLQTGNYPGLPAVSIMKGSWYAW